MSRYNKLSQSQGSFVPRFYVSFFLIYLKLGGLRWEKTGLIMRGFEWGRTVVVKPIGCHGKFQSLTRKNFTKYHQENLTNNIVEQNVTGAACSVPMFCREVYVSISYIPLRATLQWHILQMDPPMYSVGLV